MKALVKTGICALALAIATPAAISSAQEISSMYFTPKIAYSYQKGDIYRGSDTDKGIAFGAALGTDLGYYYDLPMRLELEYMYRTKAEFGNTIDNYFRQQYDVKAHTLMVNAYYDFNLGSEITPYIGGGMGFGYLKTDYSTVGYASSANDWNFVWNLGGGVAFPISDTMSLDVGYRYIDLGEGNAGTRRIGNTRVSPTVDYTAHELGVGLRFTGF